jgi:hypothetical protein
VNACHAQLTTQVFAERHTSWGSLGAARVPDRKHFIPRKRPFVAGHSRNRVGKKKKKKPKKTPHGARVHTSALSSNLTTCSRHATLGIGRWRSTIRNKPAIMHSHADGRSGHYPWSKFVMGARVPPAVERSLGPANIGEDRRGSLSLALASSSEKKRQSEALPEQSLANCALHSRQINGVASERERPDVYDPSSCLFLAVAEEPVPTKAWGRTELTRGATANLHTRCVVELGSRLPLNKDVQLGHLSAIRKLTIHN